jgi:hypothetical protein
MHLNGQKKRGLTKEKMERPTHMKVEQHYVANMMMMMMTTTTTMQEVQ